MSYIIRNTIVLGAFLLTVMIVGAYLTMIRYPRQIKALDEEIDKDQKTLQSTPDLANTYNTLDNQLKEMKSHWENRSKDIPVRDITGETYGNFTRLIDQSGDVKMDMRYLGPTASKNYGYNVYNLKGEAPYTSFFKFLWLIENGRRLYKISTLTLKGLETKDNTGETKIMVNYEIELRAFYSAIPELNIAPGQQTINPMEVASNPFHPLILLELPTPQPGEIEIERSELRAVIPGKAYIVDQNQKIRVVEEGEPVYLGYVTKIMPDQGKIECLLNKGGVSEKFELSIRNGQPIK
ncbi:MAG: hypothetical protein ACHQQQ_01560 [Bacteroidota bacterium]